MFALPAAAARLRRGALIIPISALVASIPPAVAQQYSPPAYPNPGQPPGYPGAAPPAYPSQGYGGPGAPPPPQQEAIPPPPGAAMAWQPGYWSWHRHGWVWVSGRYVSRPTRGRIGFPVIGPNDTGGGSGCRGTGDEIGRPLTTTSRSPRLPLPAIPLRAGARSVPVVVSRAQIVKLSADALGCALRAAVRGPGILNGNGGSPPRRVDPLAVRLDPIDNRRSGTITACNAASARPDF